MADPYACAVETETGVMLWPIADMQEARTYCADGEEPILLYAMGVYFSETEVDALLRAADYIDTDGASMPEEDAQRIATVLRSLAARHGSSPGVDLPDGAKNGR